MFSEDQGEDRLFPTCPYLLLCFRQEQLVKAQGKGNKIHIWDVPFTQQYVNLRDGLPLPDLEYGLGTADTNYAWMSVLYHPIGHFCELLAPYFPMIGS